MENDINAWLQRYDLAKYQQAFAENEITYNDLAELTEDDLRELGLPIGPRRRALKAASELSRDNELTNSSESRPSDPPTGSQANTVVDRRQLTVFFCDLVGSTDLSARLDPEELREVMRQYQDAVAGAVTRYGGHVAKYLGDGLLVYFGWPQAYEDQSDRAVRAGLDAVAAVAKLNINDGSRLEARVGIATGQVVVGDLVGEIGRDAEAVSGETPNLAARLQASASPGQVVISNVTRRLIGQAFSLDDLGAQQLKGFPSAVKAWRVVGEITHESRFEAFRGSAHSGLVGRDAELQLLLDRWERTKQGEGQIVLVSGEAGIGKSRLSQALQDAIIGQPVTIVRHQCSPYHSNSALYPTIQHLHRAARLQVDDDDVSRLDKVEALLKQSSADDDSLTVSLIANLLSIPFESRYGTLQLVSSSIKQRTLEVIIGLMLRLTEQSPVLFLFEDAHWIDPTSMEMLELAVSRIPSKPVMLVITHRPEWQSPFGGYNNVTSLSLSRLPRAQAEEIAQNIARTFVPGEVIEEIMARTDGVPLFIEELTKSLIEGGLDGARDNIPATLHASLLSRLDRLSADAKKTAQLGAVVGREFGHELLAKVTVKSRDELLGALEQLIESGLVFRHGAPPDATYSFKHALIQDAAYESILNSERQSLHRAIATKLKEEFPERVDATPELLAHHLTEAGELREAIGQWRQASQKAIGKSAFVEAESQLNKALDLTRQLPETNDRRVLEGTLLNLLGICLMPTRGFGNPEVSTAFLRAAAILEDTQDKNELFNSWRGSAQYNLVSGKIYDAGKDAQRVMSLANDIGQREAILEARHLCWSTDFYGGQLTDALQHIETGLELYDREDHKHLAFGPSGHDPAVCGCAHGALVLCHLGNFEKSAALSDESIDIALGLDHSMTTAVALTSKAVYLWMQGKFEDLLSTSEAAAEYCGSRGIGPFSDYAKVLRGAALAQLGGKSESTAATALIQEGIEGARKQLALFVPRWFTILADAHLKAGAVADGLAAVDQGLSLAQRGGEVLSLPELQRLRAALLLSRGPDQIELVTAELREAVRLAERVGSDFALVRASADLMRILMDAKDFDGARDTLAQIDKVIERAPELTSICELEPLRIELH